MQAGIAVRAIDPMVGCICERVPFKGPFAIGHECVAQVLAVGSGVQHIRVGQTVVVPWAVSCGTCEPCRRGLTRTRSPRGRARATGRTSTLGYDVVVEASSRAAGLRRAIRSLARGGVCTAVGYYLATGTRLPVMHMYATDATLRVGVSHANTKLGLQRDPG
jgi:threonine dehydrogenase-like Zn-dependent dehydrogenase